MSEKIRRLLEDKGNNYILPFFWQHGEDEAVLREYMGVIDACHIKAVCVESRPHPDFCGPKWWADMDVILDEARKRDMKVWILDDSHFPTGYANGGMKDQPDELHRHSIILRKQEVQAGEEFYVMEEQLKHPDAYEPNESEKIMEQMGLMAHERTFDDDRLLGIYAVCDHDFAHSVELSSHIINGTLAWKVPEGNWVVYTIHASANYGYHRSYINMMDRTSCRVLIDQVYEPHFAHYADDFGKTIAGFFSDEPELGNGHLYDINDGFGTEGDFPWSAELEEELCKRWGKDYAAQLIALWENQGDPKRIAGNRHTYMNAVTELVKKDFSVQMADWCHQHGVEYIGHVIEDNNHHSKTGSSLGHYFRGLFGQDMSGIDDIGGQVFPQGEEISYDRGTFDRRDGEFYHYLLAKLASSAAAIEPHKQGRSMCEIFGNYGWKEGVALEKYLIDHFMVRGINHFVPHAFSAKSFPDPDCPPHFYAHGHNPQYRHFGKLMQYTNRVCELISDGQRECKIAMLYHGEGDWTGKYLGNEKVGHVLYDHQIDYDIVPEDCLFQDDIYHTEVTGHTLVINRHAYEVLLVPYRQFMSEKLLEKLLDLKKAGAAVVFVGDMPEHTYTLDGQSTGESLLKECREQMASIHLEDLAKHCRTVFGIKELLSPSDDRIRYMKYVHTDGTEIIYLVNEGTENYRGMLLWENNTWKQANVYRYDAWDNQCYAVQMSGQGIHIELDPNKSCLLVKDPDACEYKVVDELPKCRQEFQNKWKRSICKSIEYPNFYDEKEISVPDALAAEKSEFSGFARYQNFFEGRKDSRYILEIDNASEGVEVFINQRSVGIQIVPQYRFDLSDYIVDGINEVVIEVATTLEREMAQYPDPYGRIPEAPSCESGITGEIRLLSD